MEKLNVKPLLNRVLIDPIKVDDKTKGGIIIPDTAKEKPQKGKVLSIGNGKPDEPLTVKVGDIVFYNKYSGNDFVINGNDYIIIEEENILAILK